MGGPGLLIKYGDIAQVQGGILVAERDDMGASNIWFDAATIVVSPWLA